VIPDHRRGRRGAGPPCSPGRHVAAELGFSELTIAGLLGHAAQGVTQRYVHLDAALILAADRVSQHIAQRLDCPRGTSQDEMLKHAPAIAAE
jgi:hypothetical protein